MGMKKIAAKQQEYRDRQASIDAFVKAADTIRDALTKITAAGEKLSKALDEQWNQRKSHISEIKGALRHASPSDEKLLDNLLSICQEPTLQGRPLPLPPGYKDSNRGYEAQIADLHTKVSQVWVAERKEMAAFDTLLQKKQKVLPMVQKIETHGIKAFEQYKKSLIAICKSETMVDRPLPITPLKQYAVKSRKEAQAMLAAWVDKQATKMPKTLKKGMSFKDYKLNRVYELTSNETQAKNKNLKGDDAIVVDCRWVDMKSGSTGGGYQISKADLSAAKHMKFLSM